MVGYGHCQRHRAAATARWTTDFSYKVQDVSLGSVRSLSQALVITPISIASQCGVHGLSTHIRTDFGEYSVLAINAMLAPGFGRPGRNREADAAAAC